MAEANERSTHDVGFRLGNKARKWFLLKNHLVLCSLSSGEGKELRRLRGQSMGVGGDPLELEMGWRRGGSMAGGLSGEAAPVLGELAGVWCCPW